MTITALRVVTTHGTYTSTPDDEARAEYDRSDYTPERIAEEMGVVIAPGGSNQTFRLRVDGFGWVAFNPAYIVAIELHEESDDY